MAQTQETQLAERSNEDYNWIRPIKMMLGSINHEEVQACSISTVPDRIRSSKEEAYSPKVVSLGPLHKADKNNLQLMEELKWRYTQFFLRRTGETDEEQAQTGEADPEEETRRLEDSAQAMRELDSVIRVSYGGTIKFEPEELATTMLVDGCFVLELLLRLNKLSEKNDLGDDSFNDPMMFRSKEKFLSVLNDLIMLENQVPFIVLKILYRKVFRSEIAPEEDRRVVLHALNAFGNNQTSQENGKQMTKLEEFSGISHLLHLIHFSAVVPESRTIKRACQELKCCATRLRARGITLGPANSNSKNCWFADKFEFKIEFQKKERKLEVPPLRIKETTEANWRNLIAWEQTQQSRNGNRSPKFTSYAFFFQGLICCEHDIELLLKNKIVIDHSGKSKKELLTFFRKITEGVEHMDSSYSETCEALNQSVRVLKVKELSIISWHWCRISWEFIQHYGQNWYSILRREHIPTVWKFIGVLAATALLVLTIMQTYYAAHSNE